MPGRYILKYKYSNAAQSFDRMPPAIICIVYFHLKGKDGFFLLKKNKNLKKNSIKNQSAFHTGG